MINLIKKEILLQKKILWFGGFYAIFLFVAFANPVFKDYVYVMAALGISYITIVGATQAEYKDNADIAMNSLPVTRKEIVVSKYLAVFAFVGIALLIVAVVGLVFHFLPAPLAIRLISVNDIIAALISAVFLAAVSMPAYFKSGAQWVRIVNVMVFMLVFFAPAQIVEWLASHQQDGWGPAISQILRQTPWLPGLSGLLVVLALLALSYIISLHIYLNKDF